MITSHFHSLCWKIQLTSEVNIQLFCFNLIWNLTTYNQQFLTCDSHFIYVHAQTIAFWTRKYCWCSWFWPFESTLRWYCGKNWFSNFLVYFIWSGSEEIYFFIKNLNSGRFFFIAEHHCTMNIGIKFAKYALFLFNLLFAISFFFFFFNSNTTTIFTFISSNLSGARPGNVCVGSENITWNLGINSVCRCGPNLCSRPMCYENQNRDKKVFMLFFMDAHEIFLSLRCSKSMLMKCFCKRVN